MKRKSNQNRSHGFNMILFMLKHHEWVRLNMPSTQRKLYLVANGLVKQLVPSAWKWCLKDQVEAGIRVIHNWQVCTNKQASLGAQVWAVMSRSNHPVTFHSSLCCKTKYFCEQYRKQQRKQRETHINHH